MPTLYRALVRHFFDRFFDRELLSPQGEARTNVVQALGLLAVPSAFFVLIFQPLTMAGWSLIFIRYLFVSFSMVVMGFLMVFQWDALFPDQRDYQILTPLPVRLSTLFLAKAGALALFLGLFLLDINFFGVLFWPGIDGGSDLLAIFSAHLGAVVAGGLFAALAAAAIQGVLITVLPARAFRRVAVSAQTLLMALAVMLLFLSPTLGQLLPKLVREDHPALYCFPGFWFVGLYECLRPAVGHPTLLRLGHLGIQALAGAAGLFILTYLPLYRRHARKVLEAPAPAAGGPGRLRAWLNAALSRTVLSTPPQRAVFHFISQTIARSVKHRLFLAVYAGFGAALAVIGLASGSSGLLRLPLTLSFILVSGLRAAFNFPSELRANWAFQLSEGNHTGECLAAMRKWIVLCAILPLFLLMAPMEFACFRWTTSLFHLAFGITLSVLLMDIMFLGFRKVPFTCAYFPGKINLAGLSVIYIYGFTTYSETMAGAESWLAGNAAAAVLFFLGAAAAHLLLARWRARQLGSAPALDYEDAGDPVVRTLGLTPE
jgi:hypothetical protein